MTTHPQFLKDQRQQGTSDPDPDPHQHYEVHCGKCHWWGYERQLRKIYSPNPLEQGGVTPELCCPLCCEAGWLEYEDKVTPSDLKESVANAVEKRWELIVAAMLMGKETVRECQNKSQQKK